MDFTKAHGTGNDFVVLLDLDDHLDLTEPLVRALCNRRLGVGADGVLRIGGSDHADVFMDYRNADGSVVEMCGNGVRVVAKHVIDHGIVGGRTVKVDTRDGVKSVEVHVGNDGCVDAATVDMGVAIVGSPEEVDLDGEPVALIPVTIGNPHAVLRVDDATTADVHGIGPRVERHQRFPDGVNVEFAEVLGREEIRLRVWERGVGETASCGTGACAMHAALQGLGLVDGEAVVHVPGGDLRIVAAADGHGVLMTGPAVEVARGHLDAAWLMAARAGAFDREVLT